MTFERRVRRTSGEERLCRATLVQLPSKARLLRVSLVDIAAEDRVRRELAAAAAILATEHDSSPDGILVVDPRARIVSVNRRFRDIFAIPADLLAAQDDASVLALAVKQVKDAEIVPSPRATPVRRP